MWEEKILEVGQDIFKKATTHLQEKFNTGNLYEHLEEINRSGDLITAIDKEANTVIRELLDDKKSELPLVLISEETGVEYFGSEPRYFMLLDPVDGSNNVRPFRTPPPFIAMSLGIGTIADLQKHKNPEAISVSVHGDIFSHRMYYALSGKGAFYQEKNNIFQLKTSPIRSVRQKCIIGIDFDNREQVSPQLKGLLESEIIQRRLGSSILDFCQLAGGQYDAYISESGRLKITDVSQSYHLVKEAGGIFEYQLLLDGEPSPVLEDMYLQRVLEEEELLARIKFRLIAAGTRELQREIKNLLKIE